MGKKGGNEAAQARADEQARQQRVREGTKRVNDIFGKNFDEPFFEDRRKAYLDYAQPQLQNQYVDAQKQLTYALDRSGLLDSSARAEKSADLQREYDQNSRAVADQALSQQTQARNAVEDARGNLITTLNATGDAEGAANSALSRASALSQPQAYSPLGQLFSTFTSTLGTQAAMERAAALSGGLVQPRYNTGLFGTSGGVQVTR